MISILISVFVASTAGAVLGWLFTKKHERLIGYSEAVDDFFKKTRSEIERAEKRAQAIGFKVYEGGKK